jgi:hypothetical protein
LKLEQKFRGKSGFETRTKTRKSNKESHGILKNRQKQMTLDRFLSKEKSSGGNVNEPQFSANGLQMISPSSEQKYYYLFF